MTSARVLARGAVLAGSLVAAALTAHSLVNLALWRRPDDDPPPTTERVSVLLPVRDEAAHVAGCLAAVRAQTGVPDLEVVVLDDASTDGTADLARDAAGDDRRVRVLDGSGPPPGWLGKPAACDRLARVASGSVLVFVDADVRLAPHAVAAAVDQLRTTGLDLVSPYPRQLAVGAGERLVQPLLQWSFLTTLPLRVAERSGRASMAAANGQLLVVDAAAYRRAGGHGAVRDQVLDDVALLRAVLAAGGHGAVTDGTALATCRMYSSWGQVRDGYAKSLWSAAGSPVGSAALAAGLVGTYVLPPVAALLGSPVGAAGWAAAVLGRAAVARRTRSRVLPDVVAHPLSVLALVGLLARSVRDHRRGHLTWKGRALPGGPRPAPTT